MTIIEALHDPALFGPLFGTHTSWRAWEAFLAAVFRLPLAGTQLDLYRRHTGRTTPPAGTACEVYCIAGRRAGKSRIAAALAVFLAAFRDYGPHLAPGEKATVAVIAADRAQARVCFRYVAALLDAVPMLAALVTRRTAHTIELSHTVVIEVHTCSHRTTRGYSFAAVIADELAFWRDETSVSPDVEVLNAVRPGLATIPGSLLICISTAYSRRGALWDAYRRHYGHEGDPVLVWQSDTQTMNPTVDPSVIAAAYEADPIAAAAEYGGEFRRDVDAFLAREAVEAVVVPGRRELPPGSGVTYTAFVDPSGGSQDAMALAIAHGEERDGQRVAVLDATREATAPFNPHSVVAEFAALLGRYGLATVRGDRYAGSWVVEEFRRHGIQYQGLALAKAVLYADLLALVNSQRVELLDDRRLLTQLCTLERRTTWGGRERIDHSPGAHDDLVNSVAGAVTTAAQRVRTPPMVRACLIRVPVRSRWP